MYWWMRFCVETQSNVGFNQTRVCWSIHSVPLGLVIARVPHLYLYFPLPLPFSLLVATTRESTRFLSYSAHVNEVVLV